MATKCHYITCTLTRYIMFFYLNYLPSDVVENMLVIFYGSLNSLETILSISNDISNQDALYSFNSKKIRLEIIIFLLKSQSLTLSANNLFFLNIDL